MEINVTLVKKLMDDQFPAWKNLPIKPVAESGWDNRTFHLGKDMLVRMPSGENYALQVEKEQRWLPKLAPHLPLPIPTPLAIGKPGEGYPWHWSINRWLEGETASPARISDLTQFAIDLAKFLIALENIDTTKGPTPGLHSFYRGGALSIYDAETRKSIAILKDEINVKIVTDVWETALSTHWTQAPVWVHGDIALGNLLVQKGRLSGVIDFGQLAIGDPACDLVIAWTLFEGESREAFRATLNFDDGTWARAQGWLLWKALIVASGLVGGNSAETQQSWRMIESWHG